MLRETGKLANGFRKYRNAGKSPVELSAKASLEKDAADFFAWLIGYWTLLASEEADDNIQSKFVETYTLGCPYCQQLPCGCSAAKRHGNRAEFVAFNLSSLSPDLAEELEKRLAELRESVKPYPEILAELERDLKKGGFSTSKKEAMNILQKIADKAKRLDEISGAGENIMKRASAVVEWIDRVFF
jgi:hypothetical protein